MLAGKVMVVVGWSRGDGINAGVLAVVDTLWDSLASVATAGVPENTGVWCRWSVAGMVPSVPA